MHKNVVNSKNFGGSSICDASGSYFDSRLRAYVDKECTEIKKHNDILVEFNGILTEYNVKSKTIHNFQFKKFHNKLLYTEDKIENLRYHKFVNME